MSSKSEERRSIATANGLTLEASYFHPAEEARAAVLIVAAMGVKQSFYAPLARWLAEQGYLAATFDYAGIGRSQNGKLSKLQLNIFDWAHYDCDAMLKALATQV